MSEGAPSSEQEQPVLARASLLAVRSRHCCGKSHTWPSSAISGSYAGVNCHGALPPGLSVLLSSVKCMILICTLQGCCEEFLRPSTPGMEHGPWGTGSDFQRPACSCHSGNLTVPDGLEQFLVYVFLNQRLILDYYSGKNLRPECSLKKQRQYCFILGKNKNDA